MAEDTSLHRDIGRLESRMDGADKRAADMQRQVENIAKKMEDVHTMVMQAQGGFKVIIAVSTAAAALGAAFTKLLSAVMPSGGA